MPTATPTEADVQFFAGFYEGEGSACKHGKRSIVVQVPQKDPEILYRARNLWGGSIRTNSIGISAWVMSGDRARRFLIAVYPYLSSRRKEQIERAGGLTLSGKKSAEVGGISRERQIARASMTNAERHQESVYQYYLRNKEKMNENARRWQKENRGRKNATTRAWRRRVREQETVAQMGAEISERSPLIQ
jgi:hypothetical protein